MISAYSTNSELPKSVAAFNSAPQKNVVAWSAMISAYARHGLHSDAVRTFSTMDLEGVRPNKITFLNVLDACGSARRGELATALDHCSSMAADFDVEMTEEHYVCVVDMLARARIPGDCRDLMQHMPFQPGVVAWTNLLLSSGHHHQLDAAKNVAQLDSKLAIPYVLWSNARARES
ncbi:hypothetical protein SELMODRAFT_122941 [Selaginella moellendorffii]|uniref:Pentacotripeptide-repeat region of PRORP domain-containing protein n=1 Tax=Selaginella moellendorffii TaxID=88036 RepID=D8SQJ6_SELML|nr:hypothetical protein SELMODRAFT_122941 [Selaginella moellendorffii]